MTDSTKKELHKENQAVSKDPLEQQETSTLSNEDTEVKPTEVAQAPLLSAQVLAEMEAFQERVASFGKALQSQMSKQRVLLEAMEREKQRYLRWRTEHPEHRYCLENLKDYLSSVYMPKAYLQEVEGMGRGIFAKDDLEAGDVVIAEEPLVYANHLNDAAMEECLGVFVHSWQVVVALAVSDLSMLSIFLEQVDAHKEQHEELFARLRCVQKLSTESFPKRSMDELVHWLGIVQSNAFSLHLKKQKAVGVFPAVAMLNHSCQPNASSYNEGTTMIVQASIPIARGEEIVHSYLSRPQIPVSQRQALLEERFGFACRCAACLRDLEAEAAL